ncbi:DUF6311 domain-containing protein [Sphingomonas sp.]|uniref:DUF6311 domain-containing protein n=1 Tax=Sphingomonas sp. TaxID=28214 RepID=UPI001EC46E67|nr:DUF6311 domain-containing protein [Sphingomonas sp.]MBX3595623.1 hypothetical protein [Sphingomonas sp.]
MRPSLPPILPLAVLPLLLFGAFFHWQILDVANIGWLLRGSDNGENALGLHAFLNDPAPAFLRTSLLNAPDGVGLLFTDSNPLVGLIAWPLRSLLPPPTQLIGWWILACLYLQVLFAWLLLRRHAPGPVTLWCGVLLLAALPSLFNRYIHANLMAHWLILWALWRFVTPERARSNAGWAVLIAVTAMIHSYLLVMVGAIWASAMAERAWRERDGVPRLIAECAAMLAMVAAIAWALGVIEPHRASGNYGAFAMPIDALWNPGVEGWSRFLPAIAQRPGRGFEGFQYLGLGLLIALAAAAILRRGLPPAKGESDPLDRLKWLVPALIVLTLLAISTYPDFAGQKLPRMPLPQTVANALDAVRASGRLFWPVAYVLVYAAIRILYRLPAERAALALAALALVQVADIAPMAHAVRAQSAEAALDATWVRTRSPRWHGMIGRARDIAFVPADVTGDLALFQEVAWRAADAGVPVRTVYAARPTLASEARQARETADFRAGRLAPGRLYIVTDATPLPPGAQLLMLDGVTLAYLR